MRVFFYYLFLSLLMGCSGLEKTEYDKIRKKNCVGDYIRRKHSDSFHAEAVPKQNEQLPYSWDSPKQLYLPKITKEFFRCRGNPLNPKRYGKADCEGALKHSLPMIHGREGIYPSLLEILNYIQMKTKKKVIVTCGHRCAVHNKYSDSKAKESKHVQGAEVDFYVRQMEYKPLDVIDLILQFYQAKNHHKKQALAFRRIDPKILKWKNKEVTISVIGKDQGRDFDNRHPYPYITIEVNEY